MPTLNVKREARQRMVGLERVLPFVRSTRWRNLWTYRSSFVVANLLLTPFSCPAINRSPKRGRQLLHSLSVAPNAPARHLSHLTPVQTGEAGAAQTCRERPHPSPRHATRVAFVS